MNLINHTTTSVKRNLIIALREMLEISNLSDADARIDTNDLETHHASGTHGLYASVRAALVSLGQRDTIEHWVDTGYWRARSKFKWLCIRMEPRWVRL